MMETKTDPSFDRVFAWKNNPRRAKLFGRRCRIIEVGSTMRSVLIEFEDGERVITSRRALR
jgi:hypothetical protein